VDGLVLLAASPLSGLARARFGGRLSWVGLEPGCLVVAYRPEGSQGEKFSPGRFAAVPPEDEITLNASIPWKIEFRSTASRVTARLGSSPHPSPAPTIPGIGQALPKPGLESQKGELKLCSFVVLGEARQVSLELARPAGTAWVKLAGGAQEVQILRPGGAGAAITVQDGAINLELDGNHYPNLTRSTRLESPGFQSASTCLEINLAGTAGQVRIGFLTG
jgi:hypothetical protein